LPVKDNSRVGFDELSYSEKNDAALIRSILLLFNIETFIASKNDQRFPFHNFKHYKNEGWDIEHIYPQTPTPEDMNYEKRNLEDILERFIGAGDYEKADERIKHYEKAKLLNSYEAMLARETVKILSNKKINIPVDYKTKIETYFVEKKRVSKEAPEDPNLISNLALLDSQTNRSYGNAEFRIKRSIILDRDLKGFFIPVCTRNVFNKAYSDDTSNLTDWSQTDCDVYLGKIKEVFKNAGYTFKGIK
jgi:hypothetical protein